MSKYDDAFAPRDPSEIAAARVSAAVPSVQAALYGRLRREFGNGKAGVIAWMLIHAADERNKNHAAACVALGARSSREVGSLFAAAEGALGSAKGADAVALARRVFDRVGVEVERVKRELGT